MPLLPPPPPPTLRSAAPSLLPPGASEADDGPDGPHPASAFSVPTSLLAASKPGSPAVSQLAFHPLSEACLVVLYADGTTLTRTRTPTRTPTPTPTPTTTLTLSQP